MQNHSFYTYKMIKVDSAYAVWKLWFKLHLLVVDILLNPTLFLFIPQPLDLFEKFALIFLNFHCEHSLLKLKIKKLLPKINVKNIKSTLFVCQKGLIKEPKPRSGSSLFAILATFLGIPALITNIWFENRKRKVKSKNIYRTVWIWW